MMRAWCHMPHRPRFEIANMNSKKILIVEDERAMLLGLTVHLECAGYEVLAAADAAAGVTLALTERPDVITTDIGMPGADGITAISLFRSMPTLQNVPVIVISGYGAAETRRQALDAGAAAFLEKPVDPSAVIAAVRSALAGGNGGNSGS
jgi:CheY-like chemotaxis protein